MGFLGNVTTRCHKDLLDRIRRLEQATMARSGHYAGMHLGDPEIDSVKVAENQSVQARRESATARELGAALKGHGRLARRDIIPRWMHPRQAVAARNPRGTIALIFSSRESGKPKAVRPALPQRVRSLGTIG